MIRSLLLLLPLAATPWLAPRTVIRPPATTRGPVLEDDTPLQKAMQTLKKAQRSLKKLSSDPVANKQALLDTLGDVESAVLVGLGQTPPLPEGLDAKATALFVVGYKRELAHLLEAALDMEQATLNGDADALQAGYSAMSSIKKEGHEAYRDF